MKTPEQIAAEIDMPISFFKLHVGEQLEAFAAAAIEADRAQHSLALARAEIDAERGPGA